MFKREPVGSHHAKATETTLYTEHGPGGSKEWVVLGHHFRTLYLASYNQVQKIRMGSTDDQHILALEPTITMVAPITNPMLEQSLTEWNLNHFF